MSNSPGGRRQEEVAEYENHGLMAAKRGRGQLVVQIPIRENGKQMQLSILATGRFGALLERDEVSGALVLQKSVKIMKAPGF